MNNQPNRFLSPLEAFAAGVSAQINERSRARRTHDLLVKLHDANKDRLTKQEKEDLVRAANHFLGKSI